MSKERIVEVISTLTEEQLMALVSLLRGNYAWLPGGVYVGDLGEYFLEKAQCKSE